MFILTKNDTTRFSKGDLQLYNFMMGYPYKKSWNRQNLIKNLMVNEPGDCSELYTIMATCPKKYNMELFSDIMEKVNLSSINNESGGINFTKTLELYYSSQ
tara:strand:- start:1047 stop:1349 length:303 start_codon:yes stop_codon:yes gene_type:complete